MRAIVRPLVGAYLYDAASRRWRWGLWDCCRFVDEWVCLNGRRSPMETLGIRYDSELSAVRRIQEGEGLAALWSLGMQAVGVPEVDPRDDLQAGDVGVIERPTACGVGEATAIWTGDKWATLALRGIECGPAEDVKVWRP